MTTPPEKVSQNSSDRDDILQLFGPVISNAFFMRYDPKLEIALSATDPEKSVDKFAKQCIEKMILIEEPVRVETPKDMSEARRYMLEELERSIPLKVFIIAPYVELMEKYFPRLYHHSVAFTLGSAEIAKSIMTNYPFLASKPNLTVDLRRKRDLGHVLTTIVDSSNAIADKIQRASMNEARVLMMLILKWKGEHVEALLPLTQAILNYENKYLQNDYAVKILNILPMLLDGFPRDATTEIDNFFDAEYAKRNESNDQVIKDFSKHVWHKINALVRYRTQADLSEEQHIMCMAQIKALGLTEEAFWPLSSPKDVVGGVHAITKNNALATTSTTQGTKVNRYLTSPENIVALVMERLRDSPSTCMNCLKQHPLATCPDFSVNATRNLAGWISNDYEAITNRSRPSYMQLMAKAVARGPGKD